MRQLRFLRLFGPTVSTVSRISCRFSATDPEGSLVILYILFNHSLIINLINMAHFNSNTGINQITGALSKKRAQGVRRISVTRKKHIHDPLTGEIVAEGPNELYLQHLRDYTAHPLSLAEQTQRAKWRKACRDAQLILRDKSHPRYMELYALWRTQLSAPNAYRQFPPFVRITLLNEQ